MQRIDDCNGDEGLIIPVARRLTRLAARLRVTSVERGPNEDPRAVRTVWSARYDELSAMAVRRQRGSSLLSWKPPTLKRAPSWCAFVLSARLEASSSNRALSHADRDAWSYLGRDQITNPNGRLGILLKRDSHVVGRRVVGLS
jgi:hypothetical protein